MSAIFRSLALFCLLLLHTQSNSYFVSKNGIDSNDCGNDNNPCGTLYFVSILINDGNKNYNDTDTIYIIDGQNKDTIQQYIKNNTTNNWNPCLPVTFDKTYRKLNITFDVMNINNMLDWYFPELCQPNDHYENQYLFQLENMHGIIMNNLIVNNYDIRNKTNYPIIHGQIFDISQTPELWDSHIICNNCTLTNISSSIRSALFNTTRMGLISQQSFFSNLQADTIFHVEDEIIRVENCRFKNISTKNSIIYSINQATGRITNIINTDIVHVTSGSIYYSEHYYYQRNINIYNVSITTNKLKTYNNESGLFYFASPDKVHIVNMFILYEYNISTACYHSTYTSNAWINAKCNIFLCKNPVMLIQNDGEVEMNTIEIDMDIFYDEHSHHSNATHFMRYQYEEQMDQPLKNLEPPSFIINNRYMDIENINIKQTICYIFVTNQFMLSITNLSIINSLSVYNPNDLHSIRIIYQKWILSSLFISNSYFIGSQFQIWLSTGTAEIDRCIFENSSMAMKIQSVSSMTIRDCKIYNNGRFNGPFQSNQHVDSTNFGAIMISDSNAIALIDTNISGYDPRGILFFFVTTNVTLKGITIDIEPNEIYYNLSDINGLQQNYKYTIAPLYFWNCNDLRIIRNEFRRNMINPNSSWIQYDTNGGINCVSGNIFTNSAIYALNTNVTSCFRLNLIKCIDNNSAKTCHETMSMVMDSSMHQNGTFIVNTHIKYIIFAKSSNIAMDNINIEVYDPEHREYEIIVSPEHNSKILLIDSYLNSGDISYHPEICNVAHNDRLSTNHRWISLLYIDCSNDGSHGHLDKTMTSWSTGYVSHLSAVQVQVIPNSTSYYPGKLLTFDHVIMDRIGNIINYTGSSGFGITLQGSTFSTELQVQDNGDCPNCKTGIIITSLQVTDKVNIFKFTISINDDKFYAANDEILLNITGCPKMFGVGEGNYTCTECNTDNYNLIENSVDKCKSCDPNTNGNIKCINKDIIINKDYWIGFDETNNNIISSMCPYSQCCQQKDGCYYLNQIESLCAEGRNYSSPLCSKCKYGYTQSMNSTNCKKCVRSIYWEYLLYPMTIALMWTLYILVITSDKSIDNNKVDKVDGKGCCDCRKIKKGKICQCVDKILSNNYLKLMLTTIWNRNIMYYEQAISVILSHGSYFILF
eukprot:374601_1